MQLHGMGAPWACDTQIKFLRSLTKTHRTLTVWMDMRPFEMKRHWHAWDTTFKIRKEGVINCLFPSSGRWHEKLRVNFFPHWQTIIYSKYGPQESLLVGKLGVQFGNLEKQRNTDLLADSDTLGNGQKTVTATRWFHNLPYYQDIIFYKKEQLVYQESVTVTVTTCLNTVSM